MARPPRAFGLALIALLAISAVAASAGSAHKLTTSTGGSVDMTGSGFAVFGAKNGVEIQCGLGSYAAWNVANTSETITITPVLNGCTSELGDSPVDMNGCTFRVHGQTTSHTGTNSGESEEDGPVDLVCPAGASLTVTGLCQIKFGAQSGRHGVSFVNEGIGTTADSQLVFEIDKLHYTTSGGFICSLGGYAATGNDGYYTDASTLQGYTVGAHGTANHVGISFK